MGLNIDKYREFVRKYIRDREELNRLLGFTAENEDSDIEMGIYMALGFLNSTPPILNIYSIENFPIPSLLVHQSVIEILISKSIVAARNDLTFNNGNVTLKVDDGSRYFSLVQALYRSTDIEITNFKFFKINQNIMNGFGGVNSPYDHLHGNNY